MENWFTMSPYAGYLLTAYGVTTLVIVANIVTARQRFRKIRRRLREQLIRRGTLEQQ